MVEIQNLTAGYPGNPVLQDVSLTFPSGKVTVLLGPNGCGKSTLLKALAGILSARGSVTVGGTELFSLPGKERAKKIAYLPQSRQIPQIPVQRLVLHGRFPYLSYPRRYRQEDEQIARNALQQLGIENLSHRDVTSLSGGQRQKAYIAMALAQSTPVILLDEPNTFLDIGHQLQLMELSRYLAGEGKTVVLVLHDLTMALEYADRLAVMEEGTVCFQGTPEEVFQRGILSTVFGVEVKKIDTPEGCKYYIGGRC